MRDRQTAGVGDTGSQGRESREQAGQAGPEREGVLLPREGFPDLAAETSCSAGEVGAGAGCLSPPVPREHRPLVASRFRDYHPLVLQWQ